MRLLTKEKKMKNPKNKMACILATLLAILSISDLNAQEIYKIQDSGVWFNQKLTPSMRVLIEYDDTKELMDEWDDFMQNEKGYDVDKVKSEGNMTLMSSEWISFEEVTPEPMQFHAQFEKHSGKTEMNLFVDFGNGYFMNPYVHKEEYKKIKMMVGEFLTYYEKEEGLKYTDKNED